MRMLTLARFLSLCAVALWAPRTHATVADDLCPPAADPCVVNTTITLTSGSVMDMGGRALQLGAGARVTLGAGQVQILAGPVRILSGARITGATGALAYSTLEIDSTGDISLEGTGSARSRIDVSAELSAGAVVLTAAGRLTMAGDIVADGRDNEASGGLISLTSGSGDLVVSGALSTTGGSDADGGPSSSARTAARSI